MISRVESGAGREHGARPEGSPSADGPGGPPGDDRAGTPEPRQDSAAARALAGIVLISYARVREDGVGAAIRYEPTAWLPASTRLPVFVRAGLPGDSALSLLRVAGHVGCLRLSLVGNG